MDSYPRNIKNTLAVISTILSILVAVMTLFLGAKIQSISISGVEFIAPTATPTYVRTNHASATPNSTDIDSRISYLENEIKLLRQDIENLSQNSSSNDTSNDMASFLELDGRIAVIEQAILDNPSRALQLPMLSQEMDNIKADYEKDLETTRQEIDRLYDLNKWFIGLMFTMAIGIISMSISNFMKKPEAVKEATQHKKGTSGSKTG